MAGSILSTLFKKSAPGTDRALERRLAKSQKMLDKGYARLGGDARVDGGARLWGDAKVGGKGILSNLLTKADASIYNGLGKIGSPEVLRQKTKQGIGNIDRTFEGQDLSQLFGPGNIKINNAGGGGTTFLQDAYDRLKKR